MGLSSGTKLGPYEIQSPLGAGGMGEVYRATDTKLGRDVALKVLPTEMARDPERLGRFRREAKSLAQLDHPNIVTIYSVEEFDGVNFLTMQLVEGQPLDRVICSGGLPLEQIVEDITLSRILWTAPWLPPSAPWTWRRPTRWATMRWPPPISSAKRWSRFAWRQSEPLRSIRWMSR